MSNSVIRAARCCGLVVMAFGLNAAPAFAAPVTYTQRNLVSDGSVAAEHTDANLSNPWGIAFNPFGFVWLSDNHSGRSTLYDGAGVPQSLVVAIPGAGSAQGAPSGIVFNGSKSFTVTGNGVTAASPFIFSSEDGIISAWSPSVDGTHALVAVDNSGKNAIYKGLAISANGSGIRLYASDFHNAKIDVFDGSFQPVTVSGFVDPNLPAGFAPFGVQAINGDLYVSYAKQDADAGDDVAGRGLGFVDVYNPDGVLLRRLASQGALNAPWGMSVAPMGFGKFEGRLLVGNFGDGRINAYDLGTGAWVGQLEGAGGKPIHIDGLWGLAFGSGFNGQPVDTLFFSAGPNDEAGGLYGRIDVAAPVN